MNDAPAVSDGLASCPLCGRVGTAEVLTARDLGYGDNVSGIVVCCTINFGGCGATGGSRETRKEAIAAWNRRPAPPSRDELREVARIAEIEWIQRSADPHEARSCHEYMADEIYNHLARINGETPK